MIKKLISTRLVSFICLLTLTAIVNSCDKDNNDVDSGKVELLSFGPTGTKHGDTLRFIGNNLHKVTAIQFSGQGTGTMVEQKDFLQISPGLILLLVPQAAEKGYVTLKTPDGSLVAQYEHTVIITKGQPILVTQV